jgi:tRNA threonylcarbamoyladenosine biosynthesis protein TsaB
MKLLAIETSTEACSVALWIDGQVRERYEIAPRRHTELVLPWAGELLAEAGLAKSQLDAIAVGRGPGAFTGVRLAVALVQGMALALDKPVLPISTLAALALPVAGHAVRAGDRAGQGEGASDLILAAIDARMGELYLGLFRRDEQCLLAAVGEEWMATAAMPNLPVDGRLIGVGSGFAADSAALVAALGDCLQSHDASALPRAADIARLAALAFQRGEAISADQLEPAYMRNKVALTLLEQAAARLK